MTFFFLLMFETGLSSSSSSSSRSMSSVVRWVDGPAAALAVDGPAWAFAGPPAGSRLGL